MLRDVSLAAIQMLVEIGYAELSAGRFSENAQPSWVPQRLENLGKLLVICSSLGSVDSSHLTFWPGSHLRGDAIFITDQTSISRQFQ